MTHPPRSTERKTPEDAHHAGLQARIAELEDAVRSRDDFLAVAAHELRSPLNALALRLSLLERTAATESPRLADDIARTRRSADRYVRRAAVLLDVARLNAGELRPHRARVDLRELVADVVEAFQDEAEFHGTHLHAVVEQDGAGWWDPHMVEQVLANLVNNAIKYGEGSPVHVRAFVAGEVACLEVSDGGPGIGEEDRARIFEKFERLVQGATPRSGFGLGLWIVGSMVAAHGGSIHVETPATGGSLFRVKLPLKD